MNAPQTAPTTKDAPDLVEAIRNHLTPQTVATVIASLQTARPEDEAVELELIWLRELLVATVGGYEGFNRLVVEVGL